MNPLPLTPHLENSFRAIGARVSARPPRLVRNWNGTTPEPSPRISVQGDVFELTLLIHRREPLIRPGGGKAHVVDELVRGQGEMVWHHAQHAGNGITPEEFAALPDQTRQLKGWSRRMRVGSDVNVHVRGAIRHPDHATIWLPGWHRVYINSERRPQSLGFLD